MLMDPWLPIVTSLVSLGALPEAALHEQCTPPLHTLRTTTEEDVPDDVGAAEVAESVPSATNPEELDIDDVYDDTVDEDVQQQAQKHRSEPNADEEWPDSVPDDTEIGAIEEQAQEKP
jgi:hypothetical protein